MPFFKDIDTVSVLERHVDRLEGLELSQARKVLKQYKIARERLKAQLLMTPDNTFTEAKLKNALVQIEAGILALNAQVKPELYSGFEYLTDQGIEDSAREVNAMEKHFNGVSSVLPVDAIIESVDPVNMLFNNYETSVMTYSQNLRGRFQHQLTQSLLQNKTWSQAVWDMEAVFNEEEWKLARIVRTELHNIYNVSKSNGFLQIRQDYLPDLQKTLYHPIDSRTGEDSKQAAFQNLIVNIDEPFEYTYTRRRADGSSVKEKRTFMAPPDRPNDRAILIPYRKSYGEV